MATQEVNKAGEWKTGEVTKIDREGFLLSEIENHWRNDMIRCLLKKETASDASVGTSTTLSRTVFRRIGESRQPYVSTSLISVLYHSVIFFPCG